LVDDFQENIGEDIRQVCKVTIQGLQNIFTYMKSIGKRQEFFDINAISENNKHAFLKKNINEGNSEA
jgi:hypothetical protein